MAPLSPLPPFQVPLPLPLLLPLSPVPVRDRLPANVLVVLCACRSVGNKLSPTSVEVMVFNNWFDCRPPPGVERHQAPV